MEQVWKKIKVLLVPSLWLEAWGLVVVEAQLRGIPVISSNRGGIPEAKLGIPHIFPDAVTEEADRVAKLPLGDREDLTDVPIVAIDPADARDHDDAVWAARDDDPKNEGGWKAIVAIADVFDALLSDRPYRPAMSTEQALELIREGRGSHFDPEVVDVLLEHAEGLLELPD